MTTNECFDSSLFIGPRPPKTHTIIGRQTQMGIWLYDKDDFRALPIPEDIDKTNNEEYVVWWRDMNKIIVGIEKRSSPRRNFIPIKEKEDIYQCWYCQSWHSGWFGPCDICKTYIKTNSNRISLVK